MPLTCHAMYACSMLKWYDTHTHTRIANEICFMSCNCILHLAHDHVGMTVVGVFMVSSLDVTLHVPPLHCVYSTASYFVFDDKLDKHTQVFLTTNCGSPTIVSIVGAPTLVLKTFAQLNTQHFVLGVRSKVRCQYTPHPHPHRITPNQCKQL